VYGHDRRLIRILKNTLFFIYPCLLLGFENASYAIRNDFPPIFREDGDIAFAQRASDDAFDRRRQGVFPVRFFSGAEEFLV